MRLLDDDMDELFRNAASQYPLNTGGADWNAIKSRLDQQDGGQAAAGNRAAGGKWYRWLWLPLLVFLFFIAHQPPLDVGYVPPKPAAYRLLPAGPEAPVNSESMSAPVHNESLPAFAGRQQPQEKVIIREIVVSRYPAIYLAKLPVKLFPGTTANTWQQHMQPSSGTTGLPEVNDSLVAALPASNDSLAQAAGASSATGQAAPLLTVQPPADSATVNTAADTAAPAKVQKGFYGGIIAGPDISSVRLQAVKNMGYHAGIVAGYRISRRVAVETGVLWDRKYYYSEGRYFSTKRIPVPPNVKVIDIDGWCNMIEIPVQVHYYFSVKEKSSWYVNAGASSYIMNKEKYDYKYEAYNNVGYRTWEYNNASRNWFSIIHAGIGHERRIGARATLRVEPYLKIPAGGVGIGSLRLSSVGLNLGITRPLRR